MATAVVVERTAQHHGIQELAALLNFCELGIVLQRIWIDGVRTI
jgi:hypothetical protein